MHVRYKAHLKTCGAKFIGVIWFVPLSNLSKCNKYSIVVLQLGDRHVRSKLLRGNRNNIIITQCNRQSIQTLLTKSIITSLPCSLILNLSFVPNNFIINIKQHLQQNNKQLIFGETSLSSLVLFTWAQLK